MPSAESESFGVINYSRQSVLSNFSLIPMKNHVLGEREVRLFINASVR